MSQTAIFWPMIGHAVLVFGLYALLLTRRAQAVKAGDARISQFRENREEPAQSLFVKNNLANQFELPLLFHAVCLALFTVGAAGTAAVTLAWLFLVLRWIHAFIHLTSNRIRHRQLAFTLGFVALVLMWMLLALRLAGLG